MPEKQTQLEQIYFVNSVIRNLKTFHEIPTYLPTLYSMNYNDMDNGHVLRHVV